MQKTFTYCDRCNANLTHEQEFIPEISVKMLSERYGEGNMEEVLLCVFCYNQLIHFFGKINPLTAKFFTLINTK